MRETKRGMHEMRAGALGSTRQKPKAEREIATEHSICNLTIGRRAVRMIGARAEGGPFLPPPAFFGAPSRPNSQPQITVLVAALPSGKNQVLRYAPPRPSPTSEWSSLLALLFEKTTIRLHSNARGPNLFLPVRRTAGGVSTLCQKIGKRFSK